MGFAYSESMWDEMYASVGGYEKFQESGGSIVRTDLGENAGEVTTTFYYNTPEEIQAAAEQPTINLEEWNQMAAESQRQAAAIVPRQPEYLNTGPLPINPILPGAAALTPTVPAASGGGIGGGLLVAALVAAAYLAITKPKKKRK